MKTVLLNKSLVAVMATVGLAMVLVLGVMALSSTDQTVRAQAPGHTTGLAMTKTCPQSAQVGTTVTCDITIENEDPDHGVNNLTVTDQVPFPGGTISNVSGCATSLEAKDGTEGSGPDFTTCTVEHELTAEQCDTFLIDEARGSGFDAQFQNLPVSGSASGATLVECNPDIDIEKATNGEDADDPPGPTLIVGETVNWTYVVTNNGDVPLSNVSVVDDQGVVVTCPQDTLGVGESMTCTAEGTVELGQYANLGTACGEGAGTEVCDEDPSHYVGAQPSIDIEKATNGEDADDPPGPTLIVGETVNWTYVVTNNGDVPLSNVSVVDDQGVVVTCPQDTLDVGESMTCTAEGTVEEGQYTNLGTACGEGAGTEVCDEDPSNYFGEVPGGGEGCTPGFWKQEQHFDSWTAPYTPDTLFSDVFGEVITINAGGKNTITDPTLLEALGATGGGINALARHAVAALLNAASPDVSFDLSEAEVIALVQGAIESGDLESAQNELAELNEQGCPLS